MDQRFEREWQRMVRRREEGASMRDVMGDARNDELVAALAASGASNPVAANAIATELLNRLRRAPFLGATITSAAVLLLSLALDFVYTGSLFVVEPGLRGEILVVILVASALTALGSYQMWRGRWRWLRDKLRRDGDY